MLRLDAQLDAQLDVSWMLATATATAAVSPLGAFLATHQLGHTPTKPHSPTSQAPRTATRLEGMQMRGAGQGFLSTNL